MARTTAESRLQIHTDESWQATYPATDAQGQCPCTRQLQLSLTSASCWCQRLSYQESWESDCFLSLHRLTHHQYPRDRKGFKTGKHTSGALFPCSRLASSFSIPEYWKYFRIPPIMFKFNVFHRSNPDLRQPFQVLD